MSKNKKQVDERELAIIEPDHEFDQEEVLVNVSKNNFRKQDEEKKEALKASLPYNAFSLVYDKEQKIYQIVSIKYSLKMNTAFVDKVETISDHQLIALDALTNKIDLTKIKQQGNKE
jgi:hypothetical protein